MAHSSVAGQLQLDAVGDERNSSGVADVAAAAAVVDTAIATAVAALDVAFPPPIVAV